MHRARSPKSRCRSLTWQQLCMSDECEFTQLLVFNFTHTYCACVCMCASMRARARVLTNKLYTHIHTVLHTCTEPITIVGTVGRWVQIVNRLMSALGGKKTIIPLFIETLTRINLMFMDPCIIVQFLQRKPQQDATVYQHFIIPYFT